FQIFYRYEGRTKALDVAPSDSILLVMLKIQSKEGVPPGFQRLSYSSKPLEADRTVADYGIKKAATIHV
ncbi:hypothetical protein EMIHUDRAFT_49382, partial [Emiliania huxleyi CCMP1516]|uniref:Ubiquitin-like domain-containing protein n=2 Tax=Emiliania huxleyi TaxID=2903 RepID=A0A0D3IWL4_EMIH1